MKYNPALDGVRAVSVTAVVAFHTVYPFLSGGMIGVDIFFVLSGYLITTLLRDELHNTGSIDLKRFYIRRFARLMPPLVFCLAGAYVGYAIFLPGIDLTPDVLFGLLYLSDYSIALWDTPEHLRHTWSLSAEEHFYLIWPLFLILTRRLSDRAMLRLLAALFVTAEAWKFAHGLFWNDFQATYYRFDTRLGGMILGGALAVARWNVSQDAARKLATAGLLALVYLMFALRWKSMPSLLIGGLAAELSAAALIVALTCGHATTVGRMLSHPGLVYIGVLSYSIYLWHYVFAYATRDHLDPVSAFAVAFVPAFAISAVSHKYIETPLRNWIGRDAVRPHEGRASQPRLIENRMHSAH